MQVGARGVGQPGEFADRTGPVGVYGKPPNVDVFPQAGERQATIGDKGWTGIEPCAEGQALRRAGDSPALEGDRDLPEAGGFVARWGKQDAIRYPGAWYLQQRAG